MKVLKFGGTSVGSVSSLQSVKNIVSSCTGQVVVVVSAMSGVTNRLIEAHALACRGDKTYEGIVESLHELHIATAEQLVAADRLPALKQQIDTMFADELLPTLRYLASGEPIHEPFATRFADEVVSYGERLSSTLIYCMFSNCAYKYSPSFIRTATDRATGTRQADLPLCEQLTREAFADFTAPVAIAPGFIAADAHNADVITNLGRGGSDFTAAIIAAALHASQLEIWTDVDGFMTAGPRTHADATVIPHMTYSQAQAMCDAGAKVIYPPTIKPVEELNIPVWVKNTFNPQAVGTAITSGD